MYVYRSVLKIFHNLTDGFYRHAVEASLLESTHRTSMHACRSAVAIPSANRSQTGRLLIRLLGYVLVLVLIFQELDANHNKEYIDH